MIERLHELFTRLGISPKVADPFIGAVALIVFHWITTGSLDVDGLRLAAGLLVLGALGVAAPPAAGLRQEQASSIGLERVRGGRRR